MNKCEQFFVSSYALLGKQIETAFSTKTRSMRMKNRFAFHDILKFPSEGSMFVLVRQNKDEEEERAKFS